jgi:hypothetical protein
VKRESPNRQIAKSHGTEFKFGATPEAAIDYLLIALLCGYYIYRQQTAPSLAGTATNLAENKK